jgi:hypothetical protein
MFIFGWVQLNVLGIVLTPNVPMDTVAEYYLHTSAAGLTVFTVLCSIGLAMYYNNFKLPVLFTCNRKEKEDSKK